MVRSLGHTDKQTHSAFDTYQFESMRTDISALAVGHDGFFLDLVVSTDGTIECFRIRSYGEERAEST
jgi:hypothetical protein